MLDTSSLRSATTKLQEMWDYANLDKVKAEPKLHEFLRTGLIQAYEYSYEMAAKTMKRFVEDLNLQNETGAEFSFRETLRHAYEHRLIADPAPWMIYRDMRNKTSRAYAEEKAIEVVSIIPSILKDVQNLLQAIETRARNEA